MHKNMFVLSSIVLLLSNTVAYSASGYSSHVTSSHSSGYSSHVTPSDSSGYSSHVTHSHHHHDSSGSAVAAFMGGLITAGLVVAAVSSDHHHVNPPPPPPYRPHFNWYSTSSYNYLPSNVVIGGNEDGRPLYVCRGYYNGGRHPGKIVGNMCNITYAGAEIPLSQYQVLRSWSPYHWVWDANGHVPPYAVVGGYENGHPLYICQADYATGTHPGKIVGSSCNIGYAGQEISISNYRVMVW